MELIKIQNDEPNNESTVTKQAKPNVSTENGIELTKGNQLFKCAEDRYGINEKSVAIKQTKPKKF